jgi:hypothetical protein
MLLDDKILDRDTSTKIQGLVHHQIYQFILIILQLPIRYLLYKYSQVFKESFV